MAYTIIELEIMYPFHPTADFDVKQYLRTWWCFQFGSFVIMVVNFRTPCLFKQTRTPSYLNPQWWQVLEEVHCIHRVTLLVD